MEIIKNICNYTNNKIYNNNISISKQRINVIEIINNLHNTKLCKDCFGTSNICKKNRCLVNRLKIIFDYIIVNNWDTTLDFVKIKQHVFLVRLGFDPSTFGLLIFPPTIMPNSPH